MFSDEHIRIMYDKSDNEILTSWERYNLDNIRLQPQTSLSNIPQSPSKWSSLQRFEMNIVDDDMVDVEFIPSEQSD